MNPKPGKSPVAYVHPSKYVDYELNPDLKTAERCITMLKDAGFDASGNPTFDWIRTPLPFPLPPRKQRGQN